MWKWQISASHLSDEQKWFTFMCLRLHIITKKCPFHAEAKRWRLSSPTRHVVADELAYSWQTYFLSSHLLIWIVHIFAIPHPLTPILRPPLTHILKYSSSSMHINVGKHTYTLTIFSPSSFHLVQYMRLLLWQRHNNKRLTLGGHSHPKGLHFIRNMACGPKPQQCDSPRPHTPPKRCGASYFLICTTAKVWMKCRIFSIHNYRNRTNRRRTIIIHNCVSIKWSGGRWSRVQAGEDHWIWRLKCNNPIFITRTKGLAC